MPPRRTPRQRSTFQVSVDLDCSAIASLPNNEALDFVKGVELAVGDLGFTEDLAKYCIAIIKKETEANREVFDITTLLPEECEDEVA